MKRGLILPIAILAISLIFLFGCTTQNHHRISNISNNSTSSMTHPNNFNPNNIKVNYAYSVGSHSFKVNTEIEFEKMGNNTKIATIFKDLNAESIYYNLSGNYISCSGYANGSSMTCEVDNASYDNLIGLITPHFNLSDKSSYNLSQNGIKVIAGIKCNDMILKTNQKFWDEQPLWKGSFILPKNPTVEVCINKPTGVALVYIIKGENTTALKLLANKVSNSVSANDFKVPNISS